MSSKQRSGESIVGATLRVGAYVAVFLLAGGFALALLWGDGSQIELQRRDSGGGESFPLVLIELGTIMLFLTPFSGVIVAGVIFIGGGERKYVALVALLVLILAVGFFTAH
jgi:uncharacterized membrane protein